jgi:hypothetical protein
LHFGKVPDNLCKQDRGEFSTTSLSRRPDRSAVTPTPEQLAHQERIGQAVAYGCFALADAETRALHEAAAARKGQPVFFPIIADLCNTPGIDALDLSAYTGKVGDLVKITARNDFGVVSITVQVANQQGMLIESDAAAETPAGLGAGSTPPGRHRHPIAAQRHVITLRAAAWY